MSILKGKKESLQGNVSQPAAVDLFLFMLQARGSSFVSLLPPNLMHFLLIVLLYSNAYGIIPVFLNVRD